MKTMMSPLCDRRSRGAYPRWIAPLLVVGVFALLCGVATSREQGTPPAAEEIRVTFIPDGDTVRCVWRGRDEWVRLLRVNTPERGRPGWREAREALRHLLERRPVTLEFEQPGVPERDRHGRLLAYVLAGGRNCSVEIVRAGWSRFWARYGAGRHASELRSAEAEARAARRGLWKQERGRRR